MLTRRMSLGRLSNIAPDSLSTLSMLLFNGLIVETFCGLRWCELVVRALDAGLCRKALWKSDLIRNPKSAMPTSRSACSGGAECRSHCSPGGPNESASCAGSCCGQTHRHQDFAYRSDLRHPVRVSRIRGCVA